MFTLKFEASTLYHYRTPEFLPMHIISANPSLPALNVDSALYPAGFTPQTAASPSKPKKCIHNKRREVCKPCGGSSLYIHDRRRYTCKDGGGSGICIHNRHKGHCKECKNSNLHSKNASYSIALSKSTLVKHLVDTIKMTGPLSVATYMRHALVHPLGGYYTTKESIHSLTQPSSADFITSPEISQIFGEMVALWCLVQYRLRPKTPIQLIELGPGRGTLMNDILGTLKQHKDIYGAISRIFMVDSSPVLRDVQKSVLSPHGIPLEFADYVQEVPTGVSSIILAHEFFDAIPIYMFQFTEQGWREILIDVDESDGRKFDFRYVIAPDETNASRSLANEPHYDSFKVIGQRIEVSPESFDIARSIATRISDDGGMALIADYGINGIVSDTLRGISKHKFVDVLNEPGSCDITADVDFSMLRKAGNGIVNTYGPVNQADFLQAMGISARLKMLLVSANAAARSNLVKGVERLMSTDPNGMGTLYKIQCMMPKAVVETPYAFGTQSIL